MSPSASALERALRCPGSFALPQANTSSRWAQDGTANHAESEAAVNAGDLPEDVARILGAAGGTARAEIAMAYDVSTDTARILGYGLDRDYGELGPYEIPGTADIGAYDDQRVYVIDRKLWQQVTPAEANKQLAHLALALCRALGKSEARVALLYEARRPDVADLDALDLDAHAARLRGLKSSIAEQRARYASGLMPDVAEGAWCRHCPAAHACPAKVALVRRLVSGEEASDLEMLMQLDDEAAAFAYERLGQAKALLKRIEAALYARAAEAPIPLGGGRFLGKHTKPGVERLDGDTVYDTVRDMYGQAIADLAVERKATKTALKAALKESGVKPLAKAELAVLDAVRAAGGSTRESTETIGEYVQAAQLASSSNTNEAA